jgi:uncharacterized protein
MKESFMTEVRTYAPALPVWTDVASPDLDRTRAFYSGLFGWDAFTVPDPAAGGYGMFMQNEKQIAGYGPVQSPEQPSAWSTYLSTDNIDATAQRVQESGGQVIAGPMDVMDQGRLAVFTDPSGAFISAWQPMQMQGTEQTFQPGTFAWAELNTRDVEQAKDFYPGVFGWQSETTAYDGGSYTEWKVDGRSIAGMMEMTSQMPDSIPPHWLVYFAVENADQTVAKAQELGAGVLMPAMDAGPGRFAVLSDPVGAVFAIIQFKQQ